MSAHILTLIIFLPVVGAAVILFLPRQHPAIRWVAAVFSFIPVLLAVQVYMVFDRSTAGMQFVERAPWIPSFNIEYYLGLDGLSTPMSLLNTLICFIGVIASWRIERSIKGYFSLFLLLESGMAGVFCALDLVLFYIFWEVMLLPMYFLIGVWGAPPRQEGRLVRGGPYAAIKFFLYTLVGSVLILLAILALYFNTTPHTFDITKLHELRHTFVGGLWKWVFIGLFIGFAIKVPVFPFHTWLPDAHVEAPTAISVILAGILLKMGIYGLLRISFPILPEAAVWFAPFLAILAVINIVYGAMCAMAQRDMKKLVAYSSINHMGYCLLGMAAINHAGLNGAVFQMFNHGTISGMLFLLVGVIYDRAHHRNIDGFGGLGTIMPIYLGMTSLAFFASLGLPGMSGFVSEVLCFMGGFEKFRTYTIISVTGIVITAAFFLITIQKVFFGPPNEKYATLPEISGRELFTLIPLAAITIILGVYPAAMLNIISTSVDNLIQLVGP